MSDSILARKYRPQNLNELIGQESLVAELKTQFKSGRIPKAYLFHGESGGGKTTIAKIIALLLQGDLLRSLTAEEWSDFLVNDITEKNAADVNGVDAMRELIESTLYLPRYPSKYKVFILNEVHRLSPAAQEALLDPVEKAETAVWILTTDQPQVFKVAFRRRFSEYLLKPLNAAEMKTSLERVARAEKIEVDAGKLADAVLKAGITSSGRALMVLEKVAAGKSIEEAIGIAADDDKQKDICKDLLKGEVKSMLAALKPLSNDELAGLRYRLLAYLVKVVTSGGARAKQAATIIDLLTVGAPQEQTAVGPWLVGRLYVAASEHGRS